MTIPRIIRIAALVPLGVSFLISYAAARDRPDAQLAVARAALEEARRSYAVQYAPVAYEAARNKLNSAEKASDHRDYDEAGRLAREAEADARLADVSARAAVAEQSVAQVQQGMGAMQQGLQPAPAGMTPPPPPPAQ